MHYLFFILSLLSTICSLSKTSFNALVKQVSGKILFLEVSVEADLETLMGTGATQFCGRIIINNMTDVSLVASFADTHSNGLTPKLV
jgi:hypothetical protein